MKIFHICYRFSDKRSVYLRYYYIYCARAHRKWSGKFEKAKFKVWYSGYECLGYIYGTQALFDLIYYSNVREQDIKQSFKLPKNKEANAFCPVIHDHFIIIDDSGKIRTDFDQLFQNVKYPKQSYQRSVINRQGKGYFPPFQYHYSHTTQEKRHSLTPEESRDIKEKYGFLIPCLKPKRKYLNSYNTYKYKRIGRSWKKHTKRKHQWKTK